MLIFIPVSILLSMNKMERTLENFNRATKISQFFLTGMTIKEITPRNRMTKILKKFSNNQFIEAINRLLN